MIHTRLALCLLLAAAPAFAAHNMDSISDDLVAEAGQGYGNLKTISGDIRVEAGATARSIGTVSGDIVLAGGARCGGVETVSGDIHGAPRVGVDGDVRSVSGDVEFVRDSDVGGDLETVSGDIDLAGTRVGGGLTTVSGDVTVGAGSHVRGGLRVKKPKGFNPGRNAPPRIVIGPNAVIDGALVFEYPVRLSVDKTARIGPVTGATVSPN